ncbi:Tyrosine-protein kinase [Parasponia andersonii]|uniref:Tyrosine-protein kinase n=1 Tax=Parasponia andersonii TaxID=3476 RepID=A0A2P5DUX0_PARAD|nr:Tyrosine-protein kinase [Parasponia andersonii]
MMEKRDIQTSISSTHVLKGSIGYITPEYGLGEKPSIAGDAYSFGVMLLELFTGKSPADEGFTEELNLSQWVKSSFPKKLGEIIDCELLKLGDDLYYQGHYVSRNLQYDCLTTVIEIGLSCNVNSPNGRLNMRNALHNLKSAKQSLLKHTALGT